jgi:heme/copper-type cytochrome/quinol oxidase subunit 2
MRALLRTGTGAALLLMIMVIGSLGLWLGTPLLWLWVGSQVQGATESVASAMAAMFVGVPVSVVLLAMLLSKLSAGYRANCRARGLRDPGNVALESVLVVSAAVTLIAFAVWFLFIAGASPVPGMNIQF